MTDPLFPFEIRLHRDAFSVHKVHHVSLTDPVLADPDKVKAWHVWRQFDSLTAPTKYKDWQRNSDNTDWLFLNAWYLDQEYADGQVPVADADGYFLPGDAGGAESGGPIDGSGTGGLIAKWADSNTLEDSSLDENTGDITSTKPIYLPAGTTGVPSLRLPHGSAPSSPTNGDLWTTTAGFFGRVNGSTVGPFSAGGGALPAWWPSYTAPSSSGWSWLNQGASTITSELDSEKLVVTEGQIRGRYRALASATPYTLTVGLLAGMGVNAGGNMAFGLFLSQPGTNGNLVMMRLVFNTGTFGGLPVILISSSDDATTWDANYTLDNTRIDYRPFLFPGAVVWLRIEDDGANRIFSWSPDGLHFHQLESHGRTDHLTATHAGFAISEIPEPGMLRLVSWLEE